MRIILLLFICFSSNLFAQDVQCGDVVSSFEGTFANSSNRAPIINYKNGNIPKVGAIGEISVYFESQFLGALVTGNLVVATAKVTAIIDDKVAFEVVEEHSSIEINGKKKNHFVRGKEVLFNQYEYDTPALTELKNEKGLITASGQMVCGKKIGVWQYFDKKGNLLEEYELNEEGEVDGTYKRYYSSGELGFECEYDDGDREGEYMGWYKSGVIKSIGKYNYRGVKEGICEEYFENGNLKSQYNDNTRLYQEWYYNGLLEREGKYDYQHKKDGVWKNYYENGNMASAIAYDGGEFEGDYKTWYDDGTLQEQKEYNWEGQKTGKWVTYYSNGKPIEEIEYSRDKVDGIYHKYFENGTPYIESHFTNGKPTGIYKEWYANGNIKIKGKYDNEGKGGKWEFYFEEGGLKYSQVYNKDEPAGIFVRYSALGVLKEKGTKSGSLFLNSYEFYFDSGILQKKGNYSSDGVKQGLWINYYENGKVDSKGNYANGKKTGKWIEHDEKGKKVKRKY